jgi:hypothetical protein
MEHKRKDEYKQLLLFFKMNHETSNISKLLSSCIGFARVCGLKILESLRFFYVFGLYLLKYEEKILPILM